MQAHIAFVTSDGPPRKQVHMRSRSPPSPALSVLSVAAGQKIIFAASSSPSPSLPPIGLSSPPSLSSSPARRRLFASAAR